MADTQPRTVKLLLKWQVGLLNTSVWPTHIFVEFENNREVFPDGISDTEFLIRGAQVWDPRDTNQDPDDETTWLWSQNAVLCALHYVRFYGAHEVPFERLPLEWWIAAINVCDEEAEFTDKDGNVTTEPRYTTNGSFTFTTKPLDVLNQLEACFAGKIFRQMGQWYVRVGAWYGNPTYTIKQMMFTVTLKLNGTRIYATVLTLCVPHSLILNKTMNAQMRHR